MSANDCHAILAVNALLDENPPSNAWWSARFVLVAIGGWF